MPNHIKNRIRFDCDPETMEAIFNRYNTHHEASLNTTYDGERVICLKDGVFAGWLDLATGVFSKRGEEDARGLPEGYTLEISQAWDMFPDFEKVIEPPGNMIRGDVSISDRERYRKDGVPNWYDWQCENWGTKWNSYSHDKLAWNAYTFETAWSCVTELIRKISEAFPAVAIEYTYADEDTGRNAGTGIIIAGKSQVSVPEAGSRDAYDIAFDLRPDYKDYYKLVDGNYEMIEEDD